eukprot:m.79505 g.79505  ORF g.79505 m.79505 type:complete len:197 (-) comp12717_c0_seq2:2797-3387(-)
MAELLKINEMEVKINPFPTHRIPKNFDNSVVWEIDGGKQFGFDVGFGYNYGKTRIRYEGEVRDGKPHGLGAYLSVNRQECWFGYFVNGEPDTFGEYVIPDMYGTFWLHNGFERNTCPKENMEMMTKVSMVAAKARGLAEEMWSRRTHRYNRYRHNDEMIMTLLLCDYRQQNGSPLPPLPTEIWEMIFSFTFSYCLT